MQGTFCATQIFLKSISVIQGTLKSKKIKSMLYVKKGHTSLFMYKKYAKQNFPTLFG